MSNIKKNTAVFLLTILVIFACKKSENTTVDESYVKGKATIYVDESLLPIVEDQEMVFESKYQKAAITLIPKSDYNEKLISRYFPMNCQKLKKTN